MTRPRRWWCGLWGRSAEGRLRLVPGTTAVNREARRCQRAARRHGTDYLANATLRWNSTSLSSASANGIPSDRLAPGADHAPTTPTKPTKPTKPARHAGKAQWGWDLGQGPGSRRRQNERASDLGRDSGFQPGISALHHPWTDGCMDAWLHGMGPPTGKTVDGCL